MNVLWDGLCIEFIVLCKSDIVSAVHCCGYKPDWTQDLGQGALACMRPCIGIISE